MPRRSKRSYVGTEGRISSPLLDEIFERAGELNTTKQQELVDELFEKAAKLGRKPSKTARARTALAKLEKITTRSTPPKGSPILEASASDEAPEVMGFSDPAPREVKSERVRKARTTERMRKVKRSERVRKVKHSDRVRKAKRTREASRAAEALASEALSDAVGFDADRTPAQGLVPLGATYSPRAAEKRDGAPKKKRKRAKSSSESRRRKSAESRRRKSEEPRRRRARSSREQDLEPISELPPLPSLPQSLPELEPLANDYGFGFNDMDEDHLAELDRLVANTTKGWKPQAPKPPRKRRDDGLVCVGSESQSDDELAIF